MKTYKKILIYFIFNFIVILIWTILQYKSYALLASTNIYESNLEYDNIDNKVISEEEILDNYIKENNNIIEFYANTFQIKKEDLIILLNDNYKELDLLNSNIDKTLLNYLLDLDLNNKELFDLNTYPCQESKEYMVALIKYWTQIYDDVDFNVAASIAQIESGYRASHMLRKNNIYGGMTKDGLISYRNIEYGTLKYIRLLHNNYYGKGLDTVEKIGRVYNPTYDSNGEKIATPAWVEDVNKTLNKYDNYPENIDIDYLLQLKVIDKE